jgi:hypothetical protein
MDMASYSADLQCRSGCWLASRRDDERAGGWLEFGGACRDLFRQDQLSGCGDAQPVFLDTVLYDDLAPAAHQPVGRDAGCARRWHDVASNGCVACAIRRPKKRIARFVRHIVVLIRILSRRGKPLI